MKSWVKHQDPDNKYGAKYTLGERDIPLPENAVISVTRGEKFNFLRLLINGIINEFVKRQLRKNDDLIYAELSGQLQGGIGQTVTVWRNGNTMNHFRTTGAHQFARRFFSSVFYGGKVQAYFLTWKAPQYIPDEKELEAIILQYGRHFDGGELIRKAQQPPQARLD